MKDGITLQPVLWTEFPYGLTARDLMDFLKGNVSPDTILSIGGETQKLFFHIADDFSMMEFTTYSDRQRPEYEGHNPRQWKPKEKYRFMAQTKPDHDGNMQVINFSDSKEDLKLFCTQSDIPESAYIIV